MKPSNLVSLEETRRRLGDVSRRTVDRLIAAGKLEKRKVLRSTKVTEASLIRYLETGS